MSEGQVFLSNAPNITLRIAGNAFEFKNGKYPARGVETDDSKIAMLKQHPEYGRTFISEEDKDARKAKEVEKANSPKAQAGLVEKAMKALEGIPGVRPSDLTASLPQPANPAPAEKSPEPESEPSEQAATPSLTRIARMKKVPLLELGARLGVEDLHETDTVPILRRKVKSWIKQNA
jgi:hypothetical protein